MNEQHQRRVLVTGGRGFVGAHLVRALEARAHEVGVFDLRDGADVCDSGAVRSRLFGVHTVVHLAAWADLYEARRDPIEAVRVNVLGTAVVADAARRAGARLVHGSTACVYGNQPSYPSAEGAIPNPTEIYAQSKLAAEQVVTGLVASHDLDATVVRFPGVYGEGLRGALAVARFFQQATRDDVLTVHGDGHQTRTPIHVEDLVRGLVAIIERPGVSGLLNLGTDDEISALELAHKIRDIVGGGRIEHGPQRDPQTMRELVDWSRARELLDWSPRISLDEGLARTWRWWRTERGDDRSFVIENAPSFEPRAAPRPAYHATAEEVG